MTHNFNISFKVNYLKDLKAELTPLQRDAALAAAEATVNQWLNDNPIPPSLLKVQTAKDSSLNVHDNRELLKAIHDRIQQIAPNLPGELKDATISDEQDALMDQSGCEWIPTPPTPPPPAGYWKCGNSSLSMNTRLDFVEVGEGDWQQAPMDRGQARCVISIQVAYVDSKSNKPQH